MHKSLLTHCIANLCLTLFILVISVTGSFAQIIGADECDCKPNVNQRFKNEIFVQDSIGKSWKVVESSGLFQSAFSTMQLDTTDTLAVVGSVNVYTDLYSIVGWTNNQSGYSITVTNGSDILVRTNANICEYPDLHVYGDDDVCAESVETYYVNIPLNELDTISWSLTQGLGTFTTSTENITQVTIEWPDTAGFNLDTLIVYANTDGECPIRDTIPITFADEGAITMACDNLIYLSMDLDCEVEVLPEMLLEDMDFTNSSYDVVMVDEETGEELIEPILTGVHVGRTFITSIVHECSNNSCWGTIVVQDKFLPELTCSSDSVDCEDSLLPELMDIGFPFPDTIPNPVKISDKLYSVQGFDFCGEATLSYIDSVDTKSCGEDLSSIIYRKWKVTDASGLSDICKDTIYLRRPVLDSTTVEWPSNFSDTSPDDLPPLNCDDKDSLWVSLPNGYPAPIPLDSMGTGYPMFEQCGNIQVLYFDTKFDKCGAGAFKLKREWFILDWCTGKSIGHNQFISVIDVQPPICIATDEFLIGATVQGSCLFQFKVPSPTVIEACSDYTIEVGYKVQQDEVDLGSFETFTTTGVTGPDADGYFTLPQIDVPGDSVWIAYRVMDDCGNSCEAFTEVYVVDEEPPIAVCDRHTTVGLNNLGWAWANAYAIDDGSHDNCGSVTLDIRRMGYLDEEGKVISQSSSCDGREHVFGDEVKFCCEDIGTVLVVEMRVTDGSNNTTTCMAQVEVQDNSPPVVTSCPENMTIDCDDDYSDLSQFGTAEFEDNCSITDSISTSFNLNSCGSGSIFRTFTGLDPYGNTAQCIQIITVEPLSPITTRDFIMPRDYAPTNACQGADIDPDNLSATYGPPRLRVARDEDCSIITTDHQDEVFQFTEESCSKVIRTWTIIDWCQYTHSGDGVLYHTQVIKINNNTAPTITLETPVITALEACQWQVEVIANATDDCPGTEIEWFVEVDEYNDGSIDFTRSTNNASGIYGTGEHKIIWNAKDECGNTGTKEQLIEIIDNKPPTPICVSELVTVIMRESRSVTIWASDFILDSKSTDNCPGPLSFSLSASSRNITSRTFTCDELEGLTNKTYELQVYVWDENNNKDFCNVEIMVQDNLNVCSSPPSSNIVTAQLSGAIYGESNEMVSDVTVMLDALLPEYPYYLNTDVRGKYAFPTLPMHNDYTILPDKNDSALNGVTTLDMVLIQKHIMGIKALSNPYKIIAADVNMSESLSAVDLVVMRKLILGITDEFPGSKSWNFVDAGYNFHDEMNPWPYPASIKHTDLDNDKMFSDFVGIKLGDVNGSATVNYALQAEVRSLPSKNITIANQLVEPGMTYSIPVYFENVNDVIGFQFGLQTDSEYFSLEDVEAGQIKLKADHVAVVGEFDDNIRISWNDIVPNQINDAEPVFYLVIRAQKNTTLKNILYLNSDFIKAEIYTEHQSKIEEFALDLELTGDEMTSESGEFILHQNIPNPFSSYTKIPFELPEDAEVSLQVFDLDGKLLISKSAGFSKGFHQFDLQLNDFDASGVYYYQLQTDKFSAIRKMILIQ